QTLVVQQYSEQSVDIYRLCVPGSISCGIFAPDSVFLIATSVRTEADGASGYARDGGQSCERRDSNCLAAQRAKRKNLSCDPDKEHRDRVRVTRWRGDHRLARYNVSHFDCCSSRCVTASMPLLMCINATLSATQPEPRNQQLEELSVHLKPGNNSVEDGVERAAGNYKLFTACSVQEVLTDPGQVLNVHSAVRTPARLKTATSGVSSISKTGQAPRHQLHLRQRTSNGQAQRRRQPPRL
ncbi:hypothetical protein BaRGS_00039291, partial [Batillaria attramentaria]